MLKSKWLYFIPLMAIFLIDVTIKSCGAAQKRGIQIPPIAACDGTPSDCLVQVVNNCPYPIYLFDTNPTTSLVYVTKLDSKGDSVYLYSVTNVNLIGRAIQIAAGNGLGANGLPSSSVTCDASSLTGACQLGWGSQGTLFEFTYNAAGEPGHIFYDISAVNGFDFPMTVQINNPTSPTTPGSCGTINTASLDVNNCSQYLNLNGTTSCSAASSTCVRQAIYASDFSHLYTGATDCFAPPSSPSANNPITSCRSPRTFGVDYTGYFGNPNPPSCPFGESILYTITPESTLTNWTCIGQSNPPPGPNPVCWTYDPNTSYYPFIKNAVGHGRPSDADASIYAFPLDDGYSTVTYGGSLVNDCSALTSRFVVTIGPLSGQATGNCPPLPSSQAEPAF